MTDFEAYQEYIQRKHNAFCKAVIRYAARDKILQLRRKWERQISLDYLMDEKFVQFAGPEPDEEYPFTVCGQTVLLCNAALAAALSAVHSDAAVKQGLRCRSYQGAETKRKRNRFTVPFFWLPKLDSNQRPARVAVPGICLRQCIALPSADRCPFDRSLFLAQRAVALSAVHSDAAVKQGLRCCSYQGAETKRKRNRFTVPFFWLPKLDSNQRPCG